MIIRDWIVICGDLFSGYEFFGPFTEGEAALVRKAMDDGDSEKFLLSVQLLKVPNIVGKHWINDSERKTT